MASLAVTSVLLSLGCIQLVFSNQYESFSGSSLRCYECLNIEMSSDMFGPLTSKSDPSCGTNPSSANTVTCPSNLNACGSVTGEISISTPFGSSLSSKVQMRGCVRDDSSALIGGCHTSSDLANELSGTLIGLASKLKDVRVNGEVCTCKWDLCTLCSNGIDVAGYCLKYWIIAVASASLIAVILLLITCCCCCCGCCGCCCCKKRRHGVVLSSPVPYHTLAVIHSSGGGVIHSSVGGAPLSIQSGDISGYDNPLASQAQGFSVDYTGPPSYEGPSKAMGHADPCYNV